MVRNLLPAVAVPILRSIRPSLSCVLPLAVQIIGKGLSVRFHLRTPFGCYASTFCRVIVVSSHRNYISENCQKVQKLWLKYARQYKQFKGQYTYKELGNLQPFLRLNILCGFYKGWKKRKFVCLPPFFIRFLFCTVQFSVSRSTRKFMGIS